MRLRPLAADDIFISYHREKAGSYARGLANALEAEQRGYICFLDQRGTEASPELPPDVIEALAACKLLVVLCTPGAIQSQFVDKEIRLFVETHGTTKSILVVWLGGNVTQAPWFPLVNGKTTEMDDPARLTSGVPSSSVVTAIGNSFNYITSKQRIRRWVQSARLTLAALALAIAGATWYANVQLKKADDAEKLRIAAEQAAADAVARAHRSRREAMALEFSTASTRLRASDPTRALRNAEIAYAECSDVPIVQEALYGAYYGGPHYRSQPAGGAVLALATSPDGAVMAVATAQGGVTLVTASGNRTRPFVNWTHNVQSIAFSPDGSLLAIGSRGEGIAVYSLDGTERLRERLYASVTAGMVFDRSGEIIFVAGPRGIGRIEIATGEYTSLAGPAIAGIIATSTDRQRIVAVGDDQIWLFTGDGTPLRHWPVKGPDRLSSADVRDIVFAPDGQRLLSADGDGGIRLWSVDGRATDRIPGQTGAMTSIAVSPGGNLFATASDDYTATIWPMPRLLAFESKSGRVLRGHTHVVRAVGFGPRDEPVTGSYDGTIRRWRIAEGSPVTIEQLQSLKRFVSYSPVAADRLLTSDGNDAVIIDPSGTVQVRFHDASTAELDAIFAAAYAPSGDFVLTGSRTGLLRLWRVDGRLLWSHKAGAEISAVLLDPDSERAFAAVKASGGGPWQVIGFAWRAGFDDGMVVVNTAERPINGLAVSSKTGTVVTAEGTGNGADGRVQIQQAGQATRQFSSERDRPKAVAYSPDRNTLLIGAELRTEQERGTTAGTTNYSAALLDRSFNTVRRLGGNRQMPTAAAFSNDGRQILIGSGLTNLPGTSEVKLWNVDGIQLLSMPAADEVNAVSFSPDGRHFATAEKDILRLWPTVRDIHERLRVLDIDGLPEADKATVDAWRTRLSLTEVTAAPRTCTAGTTQ